jgi:predicted nucleic acid-binding protein
VSVALDTNVIVTVVSGTPAASTHAVDALREYGSRSSLVISPIVYAELFAHPAWRPEDLLEFLGATAVAVDWNLTEAIWTRAGHAFGLYARRRRRSESALRPRRLLADFVIGSHALEVGMLMTGDAEFYRRNFPDLRVVAV